MKAVSEPSPLLKKRILFLFLGFGVWFVVLVIRLTQLQVFRTDELLRQVESQQDGFIDVTSRRGDILDRNLEELAVSVEADSIFCHPDQVENPAAAADALAAILGESPQRLLEKLASTKSKFVYLKRKASPEAAFQVSRLELPGIHSHRESKRIYPDKDRACHVLGFVGMDNNGLAGLEYRFEEELRGQQRRLRMRFDARRTSFESEGALEGTKGKTLVLTLDRTIQYIAEQVLERTVQFRNATGGTVILMEPRSGEIRALASYPRFDPNNHREAPPEHHRNRAISELYEPGSTFKIITLSGVLEAGLSQPEELINCRIGTVRLAGKVYREAKRGFDDLTFSEILAKSSNVGAVKLGLRLGEERFYQHIRTFGFGERTGIPLPGEEIGLLRPTTQWSRISIGALSIGQEIGVTPLQMARGIAVFANGGNLVDPIIVRQVLTPDADTLRTYEPHRQPILRPETVASMKRALAMVVSEGTGKAARLNGYSCAGKTGTAQKIVDGHYSKTKYDSSFVGFAPINNPALVAVVVINEPVGAIYGGAVAAPAFKEIMERCLAYLRVPQDLPPELPEAPLEFAQASKPRKKKAATVEAREDLILEGMEETLLNILQDKGTGTEAQTITVQLNSVTLPDFTGLSLREVARQCSRLGLQLKVTGSGVAVGQRPEPDQRVVEGTVCEVFFASKPQEPDAPREAAFRTAD